MRQTIKRILREETEIPLFVRRRFTLEDLEWLVNDVKEMIDDGESLDTAIYDGIREFIKSKNFSDIDEDGLDADYWSSYLNYERPLVRYVKSELNIRESVLREETRPLKAMRRTHLIDNEIVKLLDRVYYDKRICGRYDDADMFVRVVIEAVVENLYFNTFYMMDDTSLEWEKSVDFMYDYIKDSHGENLRNYFSNTCNERVEIDESDPKVGTGKKPKGSGRRLYTDENPSDTVSVKFRTKEDIVDTLNKDSFKSKSHKRQSQIINLIHQRVRAAYQNAKDPETKDRLKRAYDYIETVKEKSKEKTIKLQKGEQNESKRDRDIVCSECGWSWKLSEGGHDPYTCHKCGNINSKSELTEKCWPGYTQKGMKTMFGKRYPNCVKKTKK